MTVVYLDSSALVKRYIDETGSAWIRALFDPALGNEIYIAAITSVEILAAITRRARGGTITPVDAAAACARYRADLAVDYQTVELSDVVLGRAMLLAETRALRGYDAVQLATGLEVNALAAASGLGTITLVSADAELNAAAVAEGLVVEDPNTHP